MADIKDIYNKKSLAEDYSKTADVVVNLDSSKAIKGLQAVDATLNKLTSKFGDFGKIIQDNQDIQAAAHSKSTSLLKSRAAAQNDQIKRLIETKQSLVEVKEAAVDRFEAEKKAMKDTLGPRYGLTAEYRKMKKEFDLQQKAVEEGHPKRLKAIEAQIDLVRKEQTVTQNALSKKNVDLAEQNRLWEESGLKVSKFAGFLNQAQKTKDIKAIVQINELMGKEKKLNNTSAQISKWKTELSKIADGSKREGALLNPKTKENMATLAQNIEKAEGEVKDLSKELATVNKTMLGKGFDKLKELGTSKWTGFATGAVAVGAFGNVIHQLDRSTKFVSESVANMPIQDLEKRFGNLTETVNQSDGTFSKLTKTFKNAVGIRKELAVETKNAVILQEELRLAAIRTGTSLDELGDSAIELQRRFRLDVKTEESARRIATLTEQTEKLARVTGLSASEAMDFMESRVKMMGGSMEDATLNMAGFAVAAGELKSALPNMALRDYTKAVRSTIDADVRSSQNISMKNQMMRNTIALMVKQGRTQQEAMKAAENAVKSSMKGSQMIEDKAGMALAAQFNRDIKQLASLQKRVDKGLMSEEDFQKKKTKIYGTYTEGMSKAELSTRTKWLDKEFKANKDGITDTFSYGRTLADQFGSQKVMILKREQEQADIYGKMKRETAINLMAEQQDMDREVAAMKYDLWKKGDFLATKSIKDMSEEQKKAMDTALKTPPKDTGYMAFFKQASELVKSPAISAVVGTAALAATAANTFAIHANTLALGGKAGIVSRIAGKATGLFKKGGVATAATKAATSLAPEATKVAAKGTGLAGKAFKLMKFGKGIPFIGSVIGAGFAVKQALVIYEKWKKDPKSVGKGDLTKMAMSLGSMIPGIGTLVAVSEVGMDVTGTFDKMNKSGGISKPSLGASATAPATSTATLVAPKATAPTSPTTALNGTAVGMSPDGSGVITLKIDQLASLFNQNLRSNQAMV